MSGRILTKLRGRNIVYQDGIGLLHGCKGFDCGKQPPLFWTLCHRDAPAEVVRPQCRGEIVTCPECHEVISAPGRQILATARVDGRPAVGGLPFKPD
jgi:hypothetical protein